MLIELLGPSGAGKTYILKKFSEIYNYVLFSNVLKLSELDTLLQKHNLEQSLSETESDIQSFVNFCIDCINRSKMDTFKKLNALKIFSSSCYKYDKTKQLDEYGYIIIDDELLLHRAFSFLTYSSDFDNDAKKFFELVPLPDVVCMCTCTTNLIKERLLMKPKLPNCYRGIDKTQIEKLIDKSLRVCEIGEKILIERGAKLINLDLSLGIEEIISKFTECVNKQIDEYKHILHYQILKTSGSFHKKESRHTLKNQGVFYCSFSTPNFSVSKEESERDSQKRFERFGINRKNIKDKTILDLGSNCGAMLFQASNYSIKNGFGIEYDADKVILSNKIAVLSKLDNIQFVQGDIDKLNDSNIGIFDVVFALAIEAHVNNREHLLQLLSKITKETLYFEGNSKCDIKYISEKLMKYGFDEIKQLGFCDDDINPKNNKRPMLVARKNKHTCRIINILGIKINIKQ